MNCIGFIDGTVRPICRPTRHQRVCYNGHNRIHEIKFWTVSIPNGLISNQYGPMEGRRHDCALLRSSGLMEECQARQLTDRQEHATRRCPYNIYSETNPKLQHLLVLDSRRQSRKEAENRLVFNNCQNGNCVLCFAD